MLLGLLKGYKQPTITDRIAAMTSKELGGDALFFNIENVDFQKKVIKGKRLIKGEWTDVVSDIPAITWNDLPIGEKYNQYLEYEKLMQSPLTVHHRELDKSTCNEVFRDNAVLKNHLIPTFAVNCSMDVIRYVDEYKNIVLKPNQGHKGFGIKFIRKKENKYVFLNEDGTHVVLSRATLSERIDLMLSARSYHVQPEVISRLKGTEYPFVIRSYMGRGREGRWFNLFNYSAADYLSGGVVNVSQGAALQFFPNFLERQFEAEEGKIFKSKLEKLSFEFVQTYQEKIDENIDAIGLDYIVDTEGHIYMVEINYYPGTRPNSDICTVNYVRFAYYLYDKKNKGYL